MGKIIFWLVVIFAVLLVLRLVNVAKAKTRAGQPKAQPPTPMVRCVECGIYLPKSDARPVSQGCTTVTSPLAVRRRWSRRARRSA